MNKKEIEDAMKRQMFPEGFRLEKGPIGVDVVDRTYGVSCECGSISFSEDKEFEKIYCSSCDKMLAVRAIETGWVDED